MQRLNTPTSVYNIQTLLAAQSAVAKAQALCEKGRPNEKAVFQRLAAQAMKDYNIMVMDLHKELSMVQS